MSSLYLDYSPPVRTPGGKSMRKEYLKLHIYTSPKTPIERQHNRETMQVAERIAAECVIKAQEEQYFSHDTTPLIDFLTIEAERRKGGTRHAWGNCIRWSKKYFPPGITLRDLEIKHCIGFRDFFMKAVIEGRLKQNTASQHFSFFRAALRSAHKTERIPKNLADFVDGIPHESTKRDFFSQKELQALARADYQNSIARCAVLFGALSGLRVSDISALRWGNVIDGADGAILEIRITKTGDATRHPVSKQARNMMGERKDVQELVFPVSAKWMATELKNMAQNAGIHRRVHMHMLRHTYAAYLLNVKGVELYTVSKLLGHSNIATTQVYAHMLDDTKRKAAESVVIDGL